MRTLKARSAGLLTGLTLLAVSPALAQECVLDVVTSEDAVGASLSYHTDTSYTQALLISNHAYSDGSTITVVGATLCDGGSVARCIGLVAEGLAPGEERSYWFTEILRAGDGVTVTTSGYSDADLTRPLPESRYTDVYRIRRCTDS